jgi:hypothetical protein
VRGEFLGYWVKNAPLPVSLVTGDPNNPTQELLNTDQKFGMAPGFRLGFGIWLDPYENLALESNFFWLSRRTRNFFVASDDAGNPTLMFPYTDQSAGGVGNTLWPITSPGTFAGSVQFTSTLDLWGTEANATLSLVRVGGVELTGLAGFRYVDLKESLTISTVSSIITTVPFTVLSQNDLFSTRNQFYGAQLGGRLTWEGERVSLGVTGKLAMGATHQTLDIQGSSTQTGPGGVNGTFPGGFFTQPSNIGRFTANPFTLIPSVEVKLYVLLTERLRGFVGYDFLYWNNVIRPGNQIDRNINLAQTGAIFSNGGPSGPALPAAPFARSDFRAQGINVGFEFRF